jgi:flagellar FliL protein
MKRIVIFIIVGLVMFGAGFGGGMAVGRYIVPQGDGVMGGAGIPAPGPIVSIGEFTSNLAGTGRNIASFTVALEASSSAAADTILSPGWLLRVRNEILMMARDKIFEDLTNAEGTLQFAGEIQRALNAMLPSVRGEVPIVSVLFESFVLQ